MIVLEVGDHTLDRDQQKQQGGCVRVHLGRGGPLAGDKQQGDANGHRPRRFETSREPVQRPRRQSADQHDGRRLNPQFAPQDPEQGGAQVELPRRVHGPEVAVRHVAGEYPVGPHDRLAERQPPEDARREQQQRRGGHGGGPSPLARLDEVPGCPRRVHHAFGLVGSLARVAGMGRPSYTTRFHVSA